ncbi:hypothetical protein L2E82_29920 [Cichorium intybus]|uniref:Uncharacterized protein n=1 Tax=Cichorium intybus TaxID=13427 RepID=A0ACB9CZ98_CICIN|nr:hypothetical protein L2E82_29920 [Cichorium intybus]
MHTHNLHPLNPEGSNQALIRHQEMKQPNHYKFPLEAIKSCTGNFNERNFIGKGGYGSVYKGILTWGDHVNQCVISISLTTGDLLHHLARTCYKNGDLDKIIDHRITKDIKPNTLLKFSSIAYQCLQKARNKRPTIAEVAFQLKEAMEIQVGT